MQGDENVDWCFIFGAVHYSNLYKLPVSWCCTQNICVKSIVGVWLFRLHDYSAQVVHS